MKYEIDSLIALVKLSSIPMEVVKMTEIDAEKRIDKLIRKYCFMTQTEYKTIINLLFTNGLLYKINDILASIDDQDDGC